MARIRTIKPEFWQDERLATLPRDVRLMFIGLWNIADDAGRLRGSPLFIRAQVFPYDLDVDVQGGLAALERAGRIQCYSVDGESYIWICKFSEHQKIDRPKLSNLPAPTPRDESSIDRRSIDDRSLLEGKGKEGKGKEQGREAVSLPPPKTDAEAFFAKVQLARASHGLATEMPPKPQALGSWWSEALMELSGDEERLWLAYEHWADDAYWAPHKWPFRAFMKQWRDHVPAKTRATAG